MRELPIAAGGRTAGKAKWPCLLYTYTNPAAPRRDGCLKTVNHRDMRAIGSSIRVHMQIEIAALVPRVFRGLFLSSTRTMIIVQAASCIRRAEVSDNALLTSLACWACRLFRQAFRHPSGWPLPQRCIGGCTGPHLRVHIAAGK